MSRVEELIRELAKVGEVHLSPNSSTTWFVSIFPREHAPLWWYGCQATLEGALIECRNKAVKLRFLTPNAEGWGGAPTGAASRTTAGLDGTGSTEI